MNEATVKPARHKLDVNEYHRMASAGNLGEGDRSELIDGDLIEMAPIGQGHSAIVSSLAEALVVACSGRAIVWPQNPIRLDRSNEPRPDLAACGQLPQFDRKAKLPLYARAGIAELWIVDLKRRVRDAYKTPSGGGYRETIRHQPGDQGRSRPRA